MERLLSVSSWPHYQKQISPKLGFEIWEPVSIQRKVCSVGFYSEESEGLKAFSKDGWDFIAHPR